MQMSQIKQKTIEKQLGSAKLIRKFLDFINAQENSYYIIKRSLAFIHYLKKQYLS